VSSVIRAMCQKPTWNFVAIPHIQAEIYIISYPLPVTDRHL